MISIRQVIVWVIYLCFEFVSRFFCKLAATFEMRFSAAILFTGIYLFSFTELHEILRLPNLIQHYQEHLEQNESADLIGFLLSHYGGATHKGDHDHQDLPFDAGHGMHSGHPAPVSIPEHFETQFELYSEALSHMSEEPPSRVYTEYHLSIWQPPRA